VLLEEPKDAGYPIGYWAFCEIRTVTRWNYHTGKKSDLQWRKLFDEELRQCFIS
jgi:hypothetical protein